MLNEYKKELIHWNKAHNLISKNEISNIDEHMEDSLSLFPYIKNNKFIIDIGSGGGFPVIPLAIKSKDLDIKFVATDIVDKKLTFLKWCTAKFGLNIQVENLTQNIVFKEKAIITSRAFSSIKNIITWRDKHSPNSEEFYLLKGNTVIAELQEANITKYELIKNPRGYITIFNDKMQ